MKLARNFTVIVNRAMDQLIPPIIRDARWFMAIPMKLFAKSNAPIYMDFKERAFEMSDEEYAQCYIKTGHVVDRETDLNEECVEKIAQFDCGKTVLDAGCGRGFLVDKLRKKYTTTGCDVVVEENLITTYPDVTFTQAKLEALPFEDNAFDTVICTHVLEHVLDPQTTISELRRVTKKNLIIIVPRERPYRQTFSLHVHFFPYAYSLLFMIGRRKDAKQQCESCGGDWFYTETYEQ